MTLELPGDLSRCLLFTQLFDRYLRFDGHIESSADISRHHSCHLFEEGILPYPPVQQSGSITSPKCGERRLWMGRKAISTEADHSPAELVEPHPRRAAAPQAQEPL
jgi:hypothetical protein